MQNFLGIRKMTVTITEFRNAKCMNSAGTEFDVEINHPELGWIPYSVVEDDPDETIDNDALLTMIGSDYEAYVAPTAEELLQNRKDLQREERNARLEALDVLVLNPIRYNAASDAKKAEFATYRQALLDVPQQAGFPDSITWPDEVTYES